MVECAVHDVNNMATLDNEPRAKKNRPKTAKKRLEDQQSLTNGQHDLSDTSSKAAFDQLLRQAVESTNQIETKSDKKKKKQSKTNNQETVLDKLRKGEGLVKDEEDKTLLANTFDPDDYKSGKSNKRRQQENDRNKKKNTDPKIGKLNLAYEEDETIDKKKTKKKKPKQEDEGEKDNVISDLAPPAVHKKKKSSPRSPPPEYASSSTLPASPTSPRSPELEKKKKKKKKPEAPTEDQVLSETQEETQDEAVDNTKKKKKKVKAAAKSDKENVEATDEELKPEIQDEGRIVGLTIHRTDKLKTDFHISHPLVRVHVVDLGTGQYLKKQHTDRAVTSYYEKENENVDFVLPILTQPFDFKQRKSTLPVWEEMVVFNENFNYFLTDSPPVILFFEILDFVSMNTASQKYQAAKQQGGWHRIAWAFLKVLGANGDPNVDRKVRLQLYQPPARFRPRDVDKSYIEIFQWWRTAQRNVYPSTLYVTVKGIFPPEKVQPSTRSMFATQEERGKQAFDDLQRTMDTGLKRTDTARRRNPTAWTRLPGQVCKVPNEAYLVLSGGKKGCYTVRFSPDGRYLACGCRDKEGYPIIIYEIPSGKVKAQFVGHYSIVYELAWSRNNKQLLSASSDGTARLWDMVSFSQRPLKSLPHPGFVYCAKFHVRVQKIVVTGSYDHMVRVWSLQTDDSQGQLMQEMDGHISHVNALCFDEEGSKLFTGDALGQIRIWNAYVTDQPSKRGMLKDWSLNKVLAEEELKGIPINHLQLHPNGRRLLCHTRDNTLRMIDLRVTSIMQRYQGSLNYREKMTGTMTVCGSFVLTGSEDCNLYIWNAETGDQLAMFADLKYKSPVTCVDYHPHDHIMALCALGDNEPILLYRYNHKANFTETDVSLLAKSGRPGAPHMWQKEQAPPLEETEAMETARSKMASVTDDLRAQELSRLGRINKKLEAVSALRSMSHSPRHPLGVPGTSTSPVPFNQSLGTMPSTWGSTFDASAAYFNLSESQRPTSAFMQLRHMEPSPGMFSPHASGGSLMQSLQHQAQFTAQNEYMKQSSSGWRPTFSVMDQLDVRRSPSPPFSGRSPHISLNTLSSASVESSWRSNKTFSPESAPANSAAHAGLSRGLLTSHLPAGSHVPGQVSQGHGSHSSPMMQQPSHSSAAQLLQLASVHHHQAALQLGSPLHQLVALPPYLHPSSYVSLTNQGTNQWPHRRALGLTAEIQVTALYDYQAQRSDELSFRKGDALRILYKDNANWWMGELPNGQQGFFPSNYVASAGDTDDDDGSLGDYYGDRDHMTSDDEQDARTKHAAVVSRSGELKFISGAEDSDAGETPQSSSRSRRRQRKSLIAEVTIENEKSTPKRTKRRNSRAKKDESIA